MTRRPPSVRSARDGYSAANSEAARVILSDVAKYGGPESLAAQWARAYMERVKRDDVARIGPLFRQAA
jgi:hypothetical protein